MEDHYKTLGVAPNSSAEEIKKAYRRLSLGCHPDRGGDGVRFKEINAAYQILGSEERKQLYDLQRSNPLLGGAPEDIFRMFFGGGGMPFEGGMMPQVRIFHSPMGGPGMQRIRKPTAISKTVSITIQQAYRGMKYPLEVERWVESGGMRTVEVEKIYIDIPAGIDSNEVILLRGKGNVFDEGSKGDVKVFIQISNDTEFVRDALDLIYKKNLTLKEALTGFSFDIKHISGKSYTINNSNGKIITPGYHKSIANMGMRRVLPHPASPLLGDLIIVFDVDFPSNITDTQREKIKQIFEQ